MKLKSLIALSLLFLASNAKAGSMTLTHVGLANAAAASSFTRVQSTCTTGSNKGLCAPTFASSVTAGALLVLSSVSGGEGLTVATDSAHNTWTDPSGGGVGNGSARVNIVFATAAFGGSLKVTESVPGATLNCCVEEISGTTTAYTKFVTNSQAATSAITTGNVTTSESDFCVGAMTHSTGGTITLTPTSGTAVAGDNNNSADQAYETQDMTHAAGTFAHTWTSGSNVTPVSMILCFK